MPELPPQPEQKPGFRRETPFSGFSAEEAAANPLLWVRRATAAAGYELGKLDLRRSPHAGIRRYRELQQQQR